MSNAYQKARHTLEYLDVQLSAGWTNFLIAKLIHDAQANKKLSSDYLFFNISMQSCIDITIIALSKIIVHHRDPISIQYFLDYAKQNSHVLKVLKGIDNNYAKYRH